MVKYNLCDDIWDKEEIKAINRVIKSNKVTMGKKVEKYEEMFSKKIGSKYAVMSNSGSSANLLAIASLVYSGKLSAGDEVIVPAVSWGTTYFPLSQYNLKLKFVDIDKETLNIDVDQINSAITSKTKAIFAVNLLGNPNKYKKILKLCKKYNLILIEDNCEAMGGELRGKKLGTFGLLGTYSTFLSNHICTMEGGITVTDNEELYNYMLSIRSYGGTKNLTENNKINKKVNNDFYESFNFIVPGYNLKPLEIEAVIGIEQLKKIDNIILQRRDNAKYFLEKIQETEGIYTQKEIGKSSWPGFAIILCGKNIGKREELINILNKKKIEVRPIVAGNFTKHKVIKYMDYTIHKELINADYIHENGFLVGNHSVDNKEYVDFLISILQK